MTRETGVVAGFGVEYSLWAMVRLIAVDGPSGDGIIALR
jgi:hypothetical protein